MGAVIHGCSMVSPMQLTAVEARVLGALLEKAATTPEYYPLSSQALVTACNQSQNRDPVTAFEESAILDAVHTLRDLGVVRSVKRPGDRVMKHQHDLDRAWGLDPESRAVLAILLLRGPQTPGELRSRTDRYVEFPSLEEVEATLVRLATRDPALVRQLERQPGQKESRWHTLLVDEATPAANEAALPPRPNSPSLAARVAALEAELAEVRKELDSLVRALGGRGA